MRTIVVLRDMNGDLADRGLVTTLSAGVAYGAFSMDIESLPLAFCIAVPAWVDDIAIPFLAGASCVLRKGAAAPTCAWNCFYKYAMTLNTKPGKTELVIQFDGAQSEAARRSLKDLPVDGASTCPLSLCPGTHGREVSIRIVNKYTHMGKRCSPNGTQSPELAARHGSARPYVDRLTWQFFRNSLAKQENKLTAASSLLFIERVVWIFELPAPLSIRTPTAPQQRHERLQESRQH